MRAGQQARLESPDPLRQGLLQIQGSDDAILGGADGQLDQPGRAPGRHRVGVWAVRAAGFDRSRVAAEAASGHHRHLGQQCGQAAYGRRLGGPLFAADQYAADRGRYSIQDQG